MPNSGPLKAVDHDDWRCSFYCEWNTVSNISHTTQTKLDFKIIYITVLIAPTGTTTYYSLISWVTPPWSMTSCYCEAKIRCKLFAVNSYTKTPILSLNYPPIHTGYVIVLYYILKNCLRTNCLVFRYKHIM